jgi:hypothetical protein
VWRRTGEIFIWLMLPFVIIICFFIAAFVVISEEVWKRWQ